MTSGSLWNHYRDEVNDSANKTDNTDDMINNKTRACKYLKYQTKIIERTSNNSRFNSEVAVPLKSLSNLGDLLICH